MITDVNSVSDRLWAVRTVQKNKYLCALHGCVWPFWKSSAWTHVPVSWWGAHRNLGKLLSHSGTYRAARVVVLRGFGSGQDRLLCAARWCMFNGVEVSVFLASLSMVFCLAITDSISTADSLVLMKEPFELESTGSACTCVAQSSQTGFWLEE